MLSIKGRQALLSSLPSLNILNKSSSSAFRSALSNLWLLLVRKNILPYSYWLGYSVVDSEQPGCVRFRLFTVPYFSVEIVDESTTGSHLGLKMSVGRGVGYPSLV